MLLLTPPPTGNKSTTYNNVTKSKRAVGLSHVFVYAMVAAATGSATLPNHVTFRNQWKKYLLCRSRVTSKPPFSGTSGKVKGSQTYIFRW